MNFARHMGFATGGRGGRRSGAQRERQEAVSPEARKRRRRTPFFLFGFLRPHLALFAFGLLLLLAANLVFLSFPFLMGRLVDVLTGEASWEFHRFELGVTAICAVLLVVLAVRAGLSFGQTYTFGVVSNRISRSLRSRLYERLLLLPMSYYDRHRTGELISRLSNDVGQLEHAISDMLAQLVRQFVVLAFGLAIVFAIAPQLSLFMIAIIPAVSFATMKLGRTIRIRSRETQDLLAESTTVAEESISGIATVRNFTAEEYEFDRYDTSLRSVLAKALDTLRFKAALGSAIGFFVMGSLVVVIWFGATLVEAGSLAVGDLVSFVIYTGFIGGSVAGLGSLITRMQRVLGATERVVEIMQRDPEPGRESTPVAARPDPFRTAGDPKPGGTATDALPPLRDCLRLAAVSFAYPSRPDVAVLDSVCLNVGSGEHVALVGPSGSGKSTVVRLLMRFYDVNTGTIERDGEDIRSLNLESYRRRFAIVPQDVMLFGGSIFENIYYGRPDAASAEVRAAARAACVLEFADRFPDGIHTIVGERGVQLSGGQRQRVAVARAILRDPEVLILDEATSSLDAESEAAVQSALADLMHDRTTLVIAHRLATVQAADRIAVLDGGRVVEQGTHAALISNTEGLYAKLVRMQNLGDSAQHAARSVLRGKAK